MGKSINCEFWLPVAGRAEGYPYEVSDWGRVRRSPYDSWHTAGQVLNSLPNKQRGYPQVNLTNGGDNRIKIAIHALVADAFLGSPPGPIGNGQFEWQVNHKDGNKENNRLGNLEWTTGKGNHKHAADTGLISDTHYPDETVVKVWNLYYSKKLSTGEIARNLDLVTQWVEDVIGGRTRREVTTSLGEPDPRDPKGENHGQCKLLDQEVREIRRLYKTRNYTQKDLAEKFHVSRSYISGIVNYKVRVDV